MACYEPGDYCLCKLGRMAVKVGTATKRSRDGTAREVTRHRCEDCHVCPYRTACCRAKDPERQKELVACRAFSDYREASQKRITSEEGKILRINRSIQAEGSFGQLKHHRRFVRFLTGGNVKVLSELYLLAISQNILKTVANCSKGKPEHPLFLPKQLLRFSEKSYFAPICFYLSKWHLLTGLFDTIQIEIINLRIRVLRISLPRKARHAVRS